jgi:hypothetical protein
VPSTQLKSNRSLMLPDNCFISPDFKGQTDNICARNGAPAAMPAPCSVTTLVLQVIN